MKTMILNRIITFRNRGVMRKLDLVLLNTFVQVIDAKGYTAAAERLHLAQSTVSVHIKRLENVVGVILIDRTHRTPTPTAIGERLLSHARSMLNLNTLAWQDISEQRLEGVVRLGIPDDYLIYIPKVLAEFESRFPEVELHVHCGLSVDLLDMLQNGMLDLAVTTRQPNSPGGEVLCQEKTIWVGSPNFDVRKRTPLPLALSRDGYCIFRKRGIEALDAAGIKWRLAYVSSSLSGLYAAVEAGLAVTILTPSMVGQGLKILGCNSLSFHWSLLNAEDGIYINPS